MREYVVKLQVPRIGIIAVRVFARGVSQARDAAESQHPGSRAITATVVQ